MKIKNISFEFNLTIAGVYMSASLIPFRWHKGIDLRAGRSLDPNAKTGHLFAGLFHLWYSTDFVDPFAIDFKVTTNPFHGTPLI